MRRIGISLFAAIACLLASTGCTAEPTPDPPPGSAAETSLSSPAASPADSASAAPAPSTSSEAGPPMASEAPSSAAGGQTTTAPLTIYYVALEDGGIAGAEIGCGDSLVATYTEPVTFDDQLKVTMERLLANTEKEHGASGLYNALYQSDLTFESGAVDGDTVTVQLSGDIPLSGTCDAPRVTAQLEQAAQTATGTGSAEIFVDGEPLEKVLSSR